MAFFRSRRKSPTRHIGKTRPSLLLWRWRHLVVGLCIGAAAIVTLNILKPQPTNEREVVVVAQPVSAGAVLSEADITTTSLPESALPHSGLADKSVVGTRAAVALAPGTVLTTSMTSSQLTLSLSPAERLVQIPVEIGAQLAAPGEIVDVVAQSSTAQLLANANSATADANTTASNSLENNGILVCKGARVVLTQVDEDSNAWTADAPVTLVTLAVPANDAGLVVAAATQSPLGIVLSP